MIIPKARVNVHHNLSYYTSNATETIGIYQKHSLNMTQRTYFLSSLTFLFIQGRIANKPIHLCEYSKLNDGKIRFHEKKYHNSSVKGHWFILIKCACTMQSLTYHQSTSTNAYFAFRFVPISRSCASREHFAKCCTSLSAIATMDENAMKNAYVTCVLWKKNLRFRSLSFRCISTCSVSWIFRRATDIIRDLLYRDGEEYVGYFQSLHCELSPVGFSRVAEISSN